MTTINKILSSLTCIVILLISVNGALPQLQLLVIGDVVMPAIALKLLLFLLLFIAFISNLRSSSPRWLPVIIILFAAYVVFSVIRVGYFTYLPITYLIFGINAYYSYILILPFAFGLKHSIDGDAIIKWLWIISLPLSILGIAQWLTSNTIVPTESPDKSFFVGSWQFYDRVRAFSLFNSSFEYGQFVLLIIATSLATLLKSRNLWTILILGISLVSIYSTLTRNVYIGCFITISSVLMITLIRNYRILLTLPIIYTAISFWLAAYGGTLGNSRGIADTYSLGIRFSQWSIYLNDLWRGGVAQLLFGTGYVQNDRYSQSSNVVLDNTYLAVITHIGIVGLIFVVIILFSVWTYALKLAYERRDTLTIGIAAVLSAALPMSVFNIVLSAPTLLAILLIIGSKKISNHAYKSHSTIITNYNSKINRRPGIIDEKYV